MRPAEKETTEEAILRMEKEAEPLFLFLRCCIAACIICLLVDYFQQRQENAVLSKIVADAANGKVTGFSSVILTCKSRELLPVAPQEDKGI